MRKGKARWALLPWRGGGCPCKTLFFARRRRRRARREKRGTAPHPRQRADCPLQSRLSSCLTRIERQFENFGMTHEKAFIRSLHRRIEQLLEELLLLDVPSPSSYHIITY